MKKFNYLFFCLVLSLAVLTSCKKKSDEPKPDAEKVALGKLAGTWQLDAATQSNTPLSGYENMKLTITENKTFSVAGEPDGSVFPTGSFTFVEGSDFKKVLVGGVVVSLNENPANTELVTQFSLDADGNDASSKVAGLAGDYKFTFTK